MDQIRIGHFLKELRKERNLTQEQEAELFNVSARTVSRWETGSNMPDLGVLVELADYFNVDIREIMNGERKSGTMNSEMKDTLEKAAEYSDAQKQRLKKKMAGLSAMSAMLVLFAALLEFTNGFGGRIPERPMNNMREFSAGLALAILVLNAMYLNGALDKIKAFFSGRKTK